MENKFTNLKKLEVQITANCNFACFYCGNNPFTREQKVITLDYELFKRCVDELMPEEVVITGGESTLVLNEVKDFFSYTKKGEFEIH